jgi:hypothetical protein
MTSRVSLLLEQLRNSPLWPLLGSLVRVLGVALWRLMRFLVWRLRIAWAALAPRARFAVALATLVIVSVISGSVAPDFSAITHGVAVLLVAGAGLWMIAGAPFRGRRH